MGSTKHTLRFFFQAPVSEKVTVRVDGVVVVDNQVVPENHVVQCTVIDDDLVASLVSKQANVVVESKDTVQETQVQVMTIDTKTYDVTIVPVAATPGFRKEAALSSGVTGPHSMMR